MKRLLVFFTALALFAPLSGAQVREINLGSIFDAAKSVAKSRDVGSMSETDEIAVGREVAESTFGTYRIIKIEKLQRYLNAVGRWVAMQSDRPELPWHFAVVESEQVNAFAVPGGSVLVTSGMMNLLSNEAELACVLGHEISHVARKHHLTLLQKETLIQSGAKAVADNIQGSGAKREAKRFLIGEGSELYARSLDRGSERDADNDGVLLAARAGYDPGACLFFMQRMANLKQEVGTLSSLYKTHPQAAERIVDIENALTELMGVEPGSGARPILGYTNSADR
jgi:predicted Zn-dependent protease